MKLPILTTAMTLALAAPVFAAPHPVATSAPAPTPAADSDEATELAKKLNNPISTLISVPFQSNWDFGLGDGSGQRYTMNFQPVIPVSLGKDWNLILRTIIPVIDQSGAFGKGSGSQSGLGNTTQSFFFSPKEPGPGGITWGLGPVGYYPTATNDLLGPEKWGMGPSFVALAQPGSWTIGMLANQIWSVGGDCNEKNISSMFLQPFIVYTLKSHTSFAVNTETTYDWENGQWTIPLNFMVQQVFKIGKQPMALQLGYRYYAESPSGGPEWGIRANLTFLFPEKHGAAEPSSYKK